LLAALSSASVLRSEEARACGGFFCGRQPVDQTAERILFEVGQDSVTMTTQISYNGRAEDFAWILPLSVVPDVQSLAVFPQQALNALDSNTGPTFQAPNDPACYSGRVFAGQAPAASPQEDSNAGPPPVNVFIRAEVGPYDAAVVGSESPTELVNWLRNEGYRITPVMEPYVARCTEEGMKFLALSCWRRPTFRISSPSASRCPAARPACPCA
jgi:hypothetical protein